MTEGDILGLKLGKVEETKESRTRSDSRKEGDRTQITESDMGDSKNDEVNVGDILGQGLGMIGMAINNILPPLQ